MEGRCLQHQNQISSMSFSEWHWLSRVDNSADRNQLQQQQQQTTTISSSAVPTDRSHLSSLQHPIFPRHKGCPVFVSCCHPYSRYPVILAAVTIRILPGSSLLVINPRRGQFLPWHLSKHFILFSFGCHCILTFSFSGTIFL